MKFNPYVLLLTPAIAGLAGCFEADPQPMAKAPPEVSAEDAPSKPLKTVQWFIDHRDALQASLQACRSNPGELAKTADCVNATDARNKITVQEMKDALK